MIVTRCFQKTEKFQSTTRGRNFPPSFALSLLIIFFFRHQTFRHRFREVSIRRAKKRRSWKTRGKSGTCREVLFPVDGACIGPDARTRNGRLKEVLLRDKPEVIRLSRGKLSFLPAGFFVGLRPPTNIHSRLTLLFTVCGCLSNFLPLIGIFFSRAFCCSFYFFFHCPAEALAIMANEYPLRRENSNDFGPQRVISRIQQR